MMAANGHRCRRRATDNPNRVLCAMAYGDAYTDGDRVAARRLSRACARDAGETGNRKDGGNRCNVCPTYETTLSLGPNDGDPSARSTTSTVAIRNYHDSGNTTMIQSRLTDPRRRFDRLGRYEQPPPSPDSLSTP